MDDGGLTKIFSKTNKEGVPHIASILNSIVASVIIVGQISESASSLFWTFSH